MSAELTSLEPYLELLRELPFVESVEASFAVREVDAVIRIAAPSGSYLMTVEEKRSHLNRAMTEALLHRSKSEGTPPWILFAPHIGRPLGSFLEQNGVSYMDRAGNCFLALGQEHIAKIEGRSPIKSDSRKGRGLGKAGYQVIFALLAEPRLSNQPVRDIARESGAGKSTVSNTLSSLTADGLLSEVSKTRTILEPQALLDRWLVGYADIVRPSLMRGEFKTQESDPFALEERVTELFQTASEADAARADDSLTNWAFGGSAAAMRLTKYYRGSNTVVHTTLWNRNLPKELRAVRSSRGNLAVLGVPGPIALKGVKPFTVHPLLIYTELITQGGERDREAADRIREEYL